MPRALVAPCCLQALNRREDGSRESRGEGAQGTPGSGQQTTARKVVVVVVVIVIVEWEKRHKQRQ